MVIQFVKLNKKHTKEEDKIFIIEVNYYFIQVIYNHHLCIL